MAKDKTNNFWPPSNPNDTFTDMDTIKPKKLSSIGIIKGVTRRRSRFINFNKKEKSLLKIDDDRSNEPTVIVSALHDIGGDGDSIIEEADEESEEEPTRFMELSRPVSRRITRVNSQ